MIQGYNSIKEMVEPSVAATKLPWGNHFTFLNVSVPKLHYDGTNKEVNPFEFVLKTHEMVKRKRNSMGVYLTAMYLQLVRKFRGPEGVSKYVYDALKNSSFTVTNIKGPIEKMALANHPIKGLYFVVHGGPEGMMVGVVSYEDQLRVSVKVEKGFVDSHKLKFCIQQSFDDIFQAACMRTIQVF
ncbi:Wax ester synthase/diacylglycerol acyltransferase 9 [Linum perenne]